MLMVIGAALSPVASSASINTLLINSSKSKKVSSQYLRRPHLSQSDPHICQDGTAIIYCMQRVCFLLQVKPERLEEYKLRHEQVWPEMLEALHATGWHNYSLFLRPDGLLVGYVETPDFQKALDGMAALDVNARWQAEMKDFFVDAGGKNADENMRPLEHVFFLP